MSRKVWLIKCPECGLESEGLIDISNEDERVSCPCGETFRPSIHDGCVTAIPDKPQLPPADRTAELGAVAREALEERIDESLVERFSDSVKKEGAYIEHAESWNTMTGVLSLTSQRISCVLDACEMRHSNQTEVREFANRAIHRAYALGMEFQRNLSK